MSLSPRDMWQCWGHFWLTQIEGVLLASRGQRMLVIVVRCTGQLIIRDAVEKPCCGLLVLATVSVISLIASLPISNSGFPIHCGLGIWLIKLASETGWGPGPFAAVLRQTSPGATEYKETRRDKNKHVHAQLGQVMDNKTQKDQKLPTATSEELGAKQRIALAPSTQEHRSGGQTA